MKTLLLIAAAFCSLFTAFNPARAQGTAFNYQGHLNDSGSPANGTYDVQFTLYTTNITGSAIAGPVTNSATAVSNGLFTAAIDFGPGVFTGTSCWLDLALRTNGAATFTELTPRQPIAPTPYAIYSANAGNAATATTAGSASTATTSTTANSVTAGSVTGTGIASGTITAGNIASDQVVKGLNGLADFVTLAAGANIILTTNGNILQISAGTNVFTGIENNLKIIRGSVNYNGTIAAGSGFSVSYTPAGSGGTILSNFYSYSGNPYSFEVETQSVFLPNSLGGGLLYSGNTFYQVQSITNEYIGGNYYTFVATVPQYQGTLYIPINLSLSPAVFPVYAVTFATSFSASPVIIVTAHQPNSGLGFSQFVYSAVTSQQSASAFSVVDTTPNGTPTFASFGSASDGNGFDFIAIGPQ